MVPPPSTERIDKFRVVRRLGRGGMGTVYLAQDPDTDRLVAIKLLREGFDDEELRSRFATEAKSTSALRHTNIVTIFQTGTFVDRPFIVMEYIEGETFADLIARGAPIPLTRKLQLMDELCAGLQYAHGKGIVHRDIKPANVMVDQDGAVRVLDFGIARLGAGGLTQSGALIGTLNYMAPEQLAGRVVDARADVFAAGLVFYELLSLKRAFPQDYPELLQHIGFEDPEPLEALCPGIPAGVTALVNRCLRKQPGDRYQDFGALRLDLAALRSELGDEPIPSATAIREPISRPSATLVRPPTGSRPVSSKQTPVRRSGAIVVPAPRPAETRNRSRLVLPIVVVVIVVAAGAAVWRYAAASGDADDQGNRLRSLARTEWARGESASAVRDLTEAQRIDPGAAENALLKELVDDGHMKALAAERDADAKNGQNTSPYRSASEMLQNGDQLARQGQLLQALKSYLQAADLFASAGSAVGIEPVRVGGAIAAPRQIKTVAPEYPEMARSARVEGVVILEGTIGTSGNVTDVRVLRSIPLLDIAAMDAVRQWQYEPTTVNGQVVPVIMTLTVRFTLND